MEGSYNAVIYEVPHKYVRGNISGKLFLDSLDFIPDSWTIIFKEMLMDKSVDLNHIMAFSLQPILIYMGHVLPPNREVSLVIKSASEEDMTVRTTMGKKVMAVKKKVANKLETSPATFDLLFNGVPLEEDKHLLDYPISEGSELILCRGQGLMKIQFSSDDQSVLLEIHSGCTIEEVKRIIDSKIAVPCGRQDLWHNESMLEDSKTIGDYHISSGSVIFVFETEDVHRNRHLANCKTFYRGDNLSVGAGFFAQNLEGAKKTGLGKRPRNAYDYYKFGINFYGKCGNRQCISNKRNAGGAVSANLEFQTVLLTGSHHRFPCRACNGDNMEDSDGFFAASEFVVCGARSLIFFKKPGVGKVCQTLLEGKSESIYKYGTIDIDAGFCEYMYIEIITVRNNRSPFTCAFCGNRIKYAAEELQLPCKHVYHKKCLIASPESSPDSVAVCVTCNTQTYRNILHARGIDEAMIPNSVAITLNEDSSIDEISDEEFEAGGGTVQHV